MLAIIDVVWRKTAAAGAMRIDCKPEMGTGEGVDCVAPGLLTRQIVIIDVASIVIIDQSMS